MLDFAGPNVSRSFAPESSSIPAYRRHHALGQSFAAPHVVIFAEGSLSGATYRLIEGCVSLSQLLPDGRRQIIDILGPGRLFGIPVMPVNSYSAETLTYSYLQRIDDIGDSAADVEHDIRMMLHRAQRHATLLGRKTAAEKVASAVMDLAGQFARPSKSARQMGTTFTLYLTRADLADWLGLTVETVSRCLNQFKRAGIIDFSHPEIVSITDEQSLSHLAAGRIVVARTTTASGPTAHQSSNTGGQ
ncbi:MAG: Crp/Fnr family transcriptional regulator [Allorhizobium sp.]